MNKGKKKHLKRLKRKEHAKKHRKGDYSGKVISTGNPELGMSELIKLMELKE